MNSGGYFMFLFERTHKVKQKIDKMPLVTELNKQHNINPLYFEGLKVRDKWFFSPKICLQNAFGIMYKTTL